MKILEGQSNLLSNHEVYEHIQEQQKKNRSKNRRVPPNQFTLTKDVSELPSWQKYAQANLKQLLTYLRTKPGPLANQDKTHQYSAEALHELFKKLREANLQSDLSKGEMLMIVNIRPTNVAVLNTVVEDMLERFTEDEQQKIIDIITETLGFDESAEAAEGEEYDGDAAPSIEWTPKHDGDFSNLHDCASCFALPAITSCRPQRRCTYIVKHLFQQLASHGRTFHVLVWPHLLRNAIRLLRVDDTVRIILGSQISFEAQHKHGGCVASNARCPSLFIPLRNLLVVEGFGSATIRIGTHHSL